MKQQSTARRLCLTAAIAAVYTVLTLLFGSISFGPVQLRISESMTVLPILFPEAIPGLTLGCLLSNLFNPLGTTPYDVVFGTLATALSAMLTYLFRRKQWIALSFPVLVNALVVGAVLTYAYGVPLLGVNILMVGLGEAVSCFGLGTLLLHGLKRRQQKN